MLNVMGIQKSYNNIKALNDVSLSVEPGQIVSLLARNGAGKSTLISIIAGLLHADKGEVWINKEKRHKKHLQRNMQKRIGLAAQDSGIYPGLSVYHNFLFFCELYNIPKHQREVRIQEVAELLELQALMQRRGNELSGGERRRLHTGCALLHRPEVLLLDEPTVGADPQARNAILTAVKHIANEGTAILYTSHYLPEIETLDADIVIMEKGRILEKGSQKELLQRYGEHSLTVDFTADIALQAAKKLPGSHCVSANRIKIVQDTNTPLSPPALINALGEWGQSVCNLRQQDANLERTFLSIITRTNSTVL